MHDLDRIAEAYIAAWNETDAGRRDVLIEQAFTADIGYRDPVMQGDGREAVATMIAGVQHQFPGFRFALNGKPDGFADMIRFSWIFGPDGTSVIEGTDFAAIEGDRLKRVTGFLDKIPT
ncbi:nuclear transport factor 2 family protein [Sinorhizobium medicae]|uniref:nuclear transport factor 2 family protein n=1 Tax=Sinorhizobium medicae TaxID=110321 RepID=UPI000405C05D|nr:nuclear transport factor 2 family protein [Sinorhizobium medicae]MBO1942902.1 nuclear transport factor 2 family protein [Sinorhizobium medicae]MDX0429376.1 nuclear transport factor 2 family protein [Sinorhizobium medicae]MDX0441644.1 nuclear transport factor 2 family protein [Sinorhizobium medicae]MDX0459993.1 nuclear transport factor 2 family protein [Sinorhizobium medicae]MDX0484573.1 nuclear transport factor 2 family protein [Sinorhizobium medicae]